MQSIFSKTPGFIDQTPLSTQHFRVQPAFINRGVLYQSMVLYAKKPGSNRNRFFPPLNHYKITYYNDNITSQIPLMKTSHLCNLENHLTTTMTTFCEKECLDFYLVIVDCRTHQLAPFVDSRVFGELYSQFR